MLISEPQNLRLSISRGASSSSYNSKDPPRGSSKLLENLELFHTKAHTQYLHKREILKGKLTEVRAAYEYVKEKAQHEPSPNGWHPRLWAASNLVACYKEKLNVSERQLYSQYERRYCDF
jgi:hypothetical protein